MRSKKFLVIAACILLGLNVFARSWIEQRDVLTQHHLGQTFDPNKISQINNQDPSKKFHLALDSHALKRLSLGYHSLVADLLWLRFIQGHDVPVIDRKNKGWLYQLLDGVTTLDPKFQVAYSAGGTWLSVIRQDVEGAAEILERGARQFPTQWRVHMPLLYHHLYETKDRKRAQDIALHMSTLPDAPPFVPRLAARLMAEQDHYEEAISFLKRMIESTEDEKVKEQLEHKLQDLETTRKK